ncbi:MAG: hypothetical protein CMM87_02105 [Rickettsiales bacterium]|nr:hypothetical protein [Rickettsiales bacterium]
MINRLEKQKTQEKIHQATLSSSLRKQETRTKIQLGGLLLKSGLADCFDIFPGDDLQLDPEKHQLAMSLLGALIDLKNTAEKDPDLYNYWLSLGLKKING